MTETIREINNYHKNDLFDNIKNISQHKNSWYIFSQQLKWKNIIVITVFHILALYGIFTYPYSWNLKTFCTIIWVIFYGGIGGFGVTGGAHRYWTHKSYKAKMPMRIILMLCFMTSGQNSLYDWVRDHRTHHRYSETDADPHNAKRGFWFSHVGWLMLKKHPEVLERGRQINMSDILFDPVVQFQQKYFTILKLLFTFIVPIIIPIIVWNETWRDAILFVGILRLVLVLNSTWSVNSVAHLWGNKPYKKDIYPSENYFVGFIAMGEGWHNYHHLFPWDYKAAELQFYPLNLTTMWIDLAAKVGLVYDRKIVSKDVIQLMAKKYGDGSYFCKKHNNMLSFENRQFD